MQTEAAIFMYAPQTLRRSEDAKIIDKIRTKLAASKRTSVDLMHPTKESGHYARIEPNLLL